MLDKILEWVNLALLVVVIVVLARSGVMRFGSYSTVPTQLTDLYVTGNTGMDGTLAVTGAATFAGGANITGYVTSTVGTMTVTSTLAVTATSTLTGNLVANGSLNSFGSAASSTIQVGAASKAGCLILGDSADGASVVYIIASGNTVTASTTKPAACQTAR